MTVENIQISGGIVKDATPFSQQGGLVDGDKVRNRLGFPQVIGGWEKAVTDQMTGIPRGVHPWKSQEGVEFVAVGTHKRLYVYSDGKIHNITPFRAAAATLGSNPISLVSGDETATLSHTSHGAITGDTVYIAGASAIGADQVGGTSGTYATDPFSTTVGTRNIEVTQTSHGLQSGDLVTIASVGGPIGGIPASEFNTLHTVYVLTDDAYVIQVTTAATSTATGGGGSVTYKIWKGYEVTEGANANTFTIELSAAAGSTASGGGASVEVLYEINIGNEDTTAGIGFGTGTFGTGAFGVVNVASANNASTWSLDNAGNDLLALRNGGKLYRFQRVFSQRATAVSDVATDCPTQSEYMFITPERFIVLLGTQDQAGAYKPLLVRWCTQNGGFAAGDWTTKVSNTARSFTVGIGSRLIAGTGMPLTSIIWTDDQCYTMQFTTNVDSVYSIVSIGSQGLAGPQAFAKTDKKSSVYWLTSDKEFYMWAGGSPTETECPVRDWMQDNLALNQDAKIAAGGNNEFGEIWWFFPDQTSNECSLYVMVDVTTGEWFKGTFDRSCWAARGIIGKPVAAGTDGYLYIHEKGKRADGEGFANSLTTAPYNLAAGEFIFDVFGFIPDFTFVDGGLNVTFLIKEDPQDTVTEDGPYTFTATSGRQDLRISGRQIAMKIESTNWWSMGLLRLDIENSGVRP